MTLERLFLSVIVPAKDAERILPQSLRALAESTLPREHWELIVVDDGSSDRTAFVAGLYADVVIRLVGTARGPAYARNRGAERARGECVAFFDADVIVHPDTLTRMAALLVSHPDVAAAFGSYDDEPAAPGLVSQYRNLLHHFVHHQNAGDAQTFWAACGVIRRSVFFAAGKYDEWRFPRPQVEDIELGHRIRSCGHRIVLRPDIQVKHLKRWTLRSMIATDFRDRGVPWTRLLVEDGALLSGKSPRGRALNLRASERIATAAACLTVPIGGVAVAARHLWLLAALPFLLLLVCFTNRALYGFFWQKRGLRFALGAVLLHFAYYGLNGLSAFWGWLLTHVVGEPRQNPTVEAFSEVGLQVWPPVPHNPHRPQRMFALPDE